MVCVFAVEVNGPLVTKVKIILLWPVAHISRGLHLPDFGKCGAVASPPNIANWLPKYRYPCPFVTCVPIPPLPPCSVRGRSSCALSTCHWQLTTGNCF